MQYSSRLAKKQKQQTVLFFAASIILLLLVVVFGIPLVFGLTGTIISLKPKTNQVVEKGLAPNAPQLSNDFEATNTATIKISGFADAKTTVQIIQNDLPGDTVVAKDDGKFEFEVDLKKGTNTFQAEAVSDKGVKSDKSQIYTISYLNTPPKLEIDTLKDGDNVKDNPLAISGQSDPNTTVTINDRLTISDSSGKFSYNYNLSNGDNKLKFISKDQAGNKTEKEITIKYNP